MPLSLTPREHELAQEFRAFAQNHVAPLAAAHDRDERIAPGLVEELGRRGYLGALLPEPAGGRAFDAVVYGLLHEALGHACAATRSLVTAHDMVALTVHQWGTAAQREQWLKRLTTGELVAAFALSEPGGGSSDASGVTTSAERVRDSYVLTGVKRWITFGQIAGLYLVFARTREGVTALLVERETPGLTVSAVSGMLGSRGSMLAEVTFDACVVPAASVVAAPGRAHPHLTQSALTYGRYTVAWGAAAIVRACIEATSAYAKAEHRGRPPLGDHQLVQRLVARMVANGEAARLLCLEAGRLLERRDPRAPVAAGLAKYFAATAAADAARDAVQVHGANGCSTTYPVERYYRDAKVMEIIEGATELQESVLGRHGPALFAATVVRDGAR